MFGVSASFQEFFKGKNIRPLENIKGLTRTEFMEQCEAIVAEAENMAIRTAQEGKKKPLTKREIEEARHTGWLEAYRELGRRYLFWFVVKNCGNESWLDNDYDYRLCCDVQSNKWRFNVMLWVIAREHHKSTIITAYSTLWELINNPEQTFAIISYNEDIASGFLSIIKKVCENNEMLRALYPDVIWSDPARGYEYQADGRKVTWDWTTTRLVFKRKISCKEASIAAFGYSSGMTGMHYSKLLIDDLETLESVRTVNYIEMLVNAVVNLFNAAQSEDLRVTMVGTFYARNDTYCKLIFKNLIDQAIIQPCVDVETGEPIKLTRQQLAKRLKNTTEYDKATQWYCDPSLSFSSTFDMTKIKRWDATNLFGLNIYTFVDPAGTPTNKSDNTSMLTVGYDSLKNKMVIDLVRDKLHMHEKFDRLVEIMRKYNPACVFYEKVGMQADIPYLEDRMDRFNLRFPITAYTPSNKIPKKTRIEALLSEIDKFYFPYHCIHRNWQGIEEDMIETFFKEEMMPYPSSDNDDALDTLAMALHAEKNNFIIFPSDAMRIPSITQDPVLNEIEYDPIDYALSLTTG